MVILFDLILASIILWAVCYMVLEVEEDSYKLDYKIYKGYIKEYNKLLIDYPDRRPSLILKNYEIKILEYYNKLNN